MHIRTRAYGPIKLQLIDANSITGLVLPGSTVYYGESDFGTITVQQFPADYFSLRYSIYNIIRKVSFLVNEETNDYQTRYVLKGKLRLQHTGKNSHTIREGQFLSSQPPNKTSTFIFDQASEHHVFDVFYSEYLLKTMMQSFPPLQQQPDSFRDLCCNKTVYGPAQMNRIVYDLLKCGYESELRKFYFQNRVNEFLFEALVKTLVPDTSVPGSSEKEKERLYKARNLILSDISRHLTIRDLSQKTGLNAFKLKCGFKAVFGMGPFEFLLQTRMEKARDLLTSTDKPIKEIASLSGFEFTTNFINSFRKYFGYTPGELRRKK